MKTNITTENYEAYLLDYMDGNLSTDETEQLKQFVAAQGLDWDELTSPLPCLAAPEIAYDDKEKLKKDAAVVPLYVKVASAAAAAGLLLTVSLWPEKSMPKAEPLAELAPIEVSHINSNASWGLLPRRATESIGPLPRTARLKDNMISDAANQKSVAPARETTPLLAELPTKSAIGLTQAHLDDPDFGLLAYQMDTNHAFAQIEDYSLEDDEEDDGRELSLIAKGIFLLTKGKHDSFASLFGAGVRKAQQDLAEAATNMALAAYHRAEESFEETRSRWDEKYGE